MRIYSLGSACFGIASRIGRSGLDVGRSKRRPALVQLTLFRVVVILPGGGPNGRGRS